MRAPAARAVRLPRWYPRSWRSRYGEEFAELLAADIEERPRSRSRTADVIRGGIAARLGAAGLGEAGRLPGPGTHRTSASLASLGCCAAVFAGDAVTHAAALGRRPVRVASGYADPFRPGGPGAGPGAAGGSRDGVRPGVPRRCLLRRAAAALARLPGRPAGLAGLHPGSIAGSRGFPGPLYKSGDATER